MEYEILIRKLVDLDCQDMRIINSGVVNDDLFNKELYYGYSITKLLKIIYQSLKIPSKNFLKLTELVEQNSVLRFSYLIDCQRELDIKFEFMNDDKVELDNFEGSLLQEKQFLALIEQEDKYINKFLLPKSDDMSSLQVTGQNY